MTEIEIVLALLLVNGALGAFDTLWFHEYRAGLARRPGHRVELALHAGRDAVYVVIYGSLGWVEWRGLAALALAALLAAEIVITLADFVVEDRTRDLPAGERVAHAVMAIIYGAMLAHLVPLLVDWFEAPTAIAAHSDAPPTSMAVAASLAAAGILGSGLRDAAAAMSPTPPAPADRQARRTMMLPTE